MTLYEILEVKQTASDREIKRSYRRLAKLYHPDTGGHEKRFQQIQSAYETLSDKQKRAEYDRRITPVPEPGSLRYLRPAPITSYRVHLDRDDIVAYLEWIADAFEGEARRIALEQLAKSLKEMR